MNLTGRDVDLENLENEHEIDLAVQDPAWEELSGMEELALDAVKATLAMAVLPRRCEDRVLEVSLVLANDDLVQVLNREYRHKDRPTNVLSFASLDETDMPEVDGSPLNIGDVILAYKTIEKEASDQDKFIQDHAAHLIVHGVLHLLGYDHIEEDDANVMESTEIRILEKLGIQNPYTELLTLG